ncbi:MAG: hypothetical protein COT71_03990 [Candidatus Andersenbacteria bacterium CG10_big_fil_rev_8_21_14_0_10_54_11]|uniref:Uncharacterized protein n=1 Tax=Candidatus Andersenbacteria bacterium CG10_big_fil_rev_8_21_14_0_10_54_11 TaxID=1974485 RepID=A0A2M6WYG4_9BACT|nr:MAG: hypothetical protein COT71_03990 [Candidatus Andersenbacteria bacterium CG10_big_fil_rev_8_21_14_0_10_54_11]
MLKVQSAQPEQALRQGYFCALLMLIIMPALCLRLALKIWNVPPAGYDAASVLAVSAVLVLSAIASAIISAVALRANICLLRQYAAGRQAARMLIRQKK